MGVTVLALELNWLVNLGYALLAFKAKKKYIYIYIQHKFFSSMII